MGGMQDFIFSKYGGWRDLGEATNGKSCSLWWKNLKEVWYSKGWGRCFKDSFEWKVGNGTDICFRKDSWLMGEALKNVFPRIFSVSSNKNAKLSKLGSWSNGRRVWGLVWRRPFFEWEKPAADRLSQLLLGVEVVLEETDSWIWKGENPHPSNCLLYTSDAADE